MEAGGDVSVDPGTFEQKRLGWHNSLPDSLARRVARAGTNESLLFSLGTMGMGRVVIFTRVVMYVKTLRSVVNFFFIYADRM